MRLESPAKIRFRPQRGIAWILAALCVFGTAPRPSRADDTQPLTAIFIVGKPDMPDDDFANSVVLVMNNLAAVPVGIVVNRPTHITIAQLFPDESRLARLNDKVYFGGPVDFGSIWFLLRAAAPPAHATLAFDGVYLSADRELLMKLLSRSKPMQDLKIFMGHAGWAPGQLESEIERGAWTLEHADPEAVFNPKMQHLWPATRAPKDSI